MGGLLSREVCPEGVIAGVRPLPVHQQKCICTSPWKNYQLAVKLPYSFGRLVCGLGNKAEQLVLLSLFFICGGCQIPRVAEWKRWCPPFSHVLQKMRLVPLEAQRNEWLKFLSSHWPGLVWQQFIAATC